MNQTGLTEGHTTRLVACKTVETMLGAFLLLLPVEAVHITKLTYI